MPTDGAELDRPLDTHSLPPSPELDVPEGALEESACGLCGSRSATVVYEACPDRLLLMPGRFDVVRCDTCGLARTNPRPTRESIGLWYPDDYSFFTVDEADRSSAYGALRTAVRFPFRIRYGRVEPEPPAHERDRLLDIGAGTGLFLAEMAKLGWDPWAIEPHPESARKALARLELEADRIFVGLAEEARFEPESFDLVTMSHVLEHLHDPKAVLEQVRTWLRPSGSLRIWLPNFGSLERRVFGRNWQGLDIPRHLYHYSSKTLRALLEAAGFAVERAIPQWQANMLTGSVTYAWDSARGRRRRYQESRGLHFGLLPASSILLALGEGGCLDLTARKPEAP